MLDLNPARCCGGCCSAVPPLNSHSIPACSSITIFQIVYYDGQFNDSRLNVALATTAAAAGAVMLNYVRVVSLIKVRLVATLDL